MAFIYVLTIIVCILIILVVLIQNSKGGGLASGIAGNQIMGVRKTADFLEKATWTMAIVLLVFCITANLLVPNKQNVQKSILQDEIQNAIDPNAVPRIPNATQQQPSQQPTAPQQNGEKK